MCVCLCVFFSGLFFDFLDLFSLMVVTRISFVASSRFIFFFFFGSPKAQLTHNLVTTYMLARAVVVAGTSEGEAGREGR